MGVLGTSLERVYPRHHETFQAEVSRQGLLLSELSPGTAMRRGSFVERNRLIVALAKALVVVECPERSGALISAKFASQLQCPVWVVPGDARRWSSRGSNALLRNQASPLLTTADLAEHLVAGPLMAASTTVAQVDLLRRSEMAHPLRRSSGAWGRRRIIFPLGFWPLSVKDSWYVRLAIFGGDADRDDRAVPCRQ